MAESKYKKLIKQFKKSMKEVSLILGIPVHEIRKKDYITVTTLFEIEDRLSNDYLAIIGGFKRAMMFYIDRDIPRTIKPKVLLYDIETSPIEAHVWGLYKNDVGLNQIVKDWSVLSWSAKFQGEDKIHYMDTRGQKDIRDDRRILESLWKLLNEADVVVTQNGKKFDEGKLNARFAMLGMEPPRKPKHIDTCEIARRYFNFTSNRLAYLSENLNKKYKKLDHKKFPGHSLWVECLKDNKEAWEEMEEYNKFDVLALEELYENLIKWDVTKPQNVEVCPCGSNKMQKRGFIYTLTEKFQRYRCKVCGQESIGHINLLGE